MSETTTLSAPDWVTAIGLIASAVVAIVGYLLDNHKARQLSETQAQLERESRAEMARLERESRDAAAQARLKHLCDQAELARVRQQISVFIGPLHRHFKVTNTATLNFFLVRGHYPDIMKYYGQLFQRKPAYGAIPCPPALCEQMSADPQSTCAREYRTLCRDILVPYHSVCRQLILEHGSDLADTPAEDVWDAKFSPEQLASPGTKSTTHFGVLDAYCLYSKEFEQVVREWDEEKGVFERWQPQAPIPVLMNVLVDAMFAQVKKREGVFVASVEEYRGSKAGGLDVSAAWDATTATGSPRTAGGSQAAKANQVAPAPRTLDPAAID